MGWILRAGDQASRGQPPKAVRQDVGGDALFRVRQQLAEVSPVAEHQVADDDQAPAVAEQLERQVDRTPGPVRVAQGGASETACNMKSVARRRNRRRRDRYLPEPALRFA